jgi:acyl-CoA synthetase (AMP-forming)/AMP-acid ligase II
MLYETPFQALVNTAGVFGEKSAIIQGGRVLSFKKWVREASKFANFLHSLGVGKGDKVVLHLPNTIDYAIAQLGTWGIGAVSVPLDMGITEENFRKTLEHCDAKVVVTVQDAPFNSRSIAGSIKSVTDIIVLPEGVSGEHSFAKIMMEGDSSLPSAKPDFKDPSVIYYTSGTTGEPKGILWNYQHLLAFPMIIEHFNYISSSDVSLCALPLSHAGGTVHFQGCAYIGWTVVLMEKFRPGEFISLCEKYKVTFFVAVPPIFVAAMMSDEFLKADLSSLERVVSFGAMANEAAMKRFKERCPNARLLNGYGLMESAPPNTVIPLDSDAPVTSVGKPPPWVEIRVVDDQDRALPTGEVGEVCIRGWVLMEGYYKAPDLTEETIRNGWLYTGDLGKFDEKGLLYIVGRKKDIIIVGGLNVVATDIENLIKTHPAVSDCAVIAAKHYARGEVVKAVVELKKGMKATETEIIDFVRNKLESYKLPRIVEFVDALPRTRTGKVMKRLLIEREQQK